MATAPIAFPRLIKTRGPWVMQTPLQSDGSNSFVAGQFVKLTGGYLAPYVADDTGIYGLTLDGSHLPTDEAYSSPFGENHNPVALSGNRFVMNLTDGSGTVGSGTTTQGSVTIGAYYSGMYLASPYGNVVAVDLSDTGTATKNIFKVVEIYTPSAGYSDGDSNGDFNGRVVVEILGTAIQS